MVACGWLAVVAAPPLINIEYNRRTIMILVVNLDETIIKEGDVVNDSA